MLFVLRSNPFVLFLRRDHRDLSSVSLRSTAMFVGMGDAFHFEMTPLPPQPGSMQNPLYAIENLDLHLEYHFRRRKWANEELK